MKKLILHSMRAERGAALITGLIFMVVLTLISVAAMRTTLLEEKMAGNARDTDLAFQAAEAALRPGEQIINGAALPSFTASGAHLSSTGNATRGNDSTGRKPTTGPPIRSHSLPCRRAPIPPRAK